MDVLLESMLKELKIEPVKSLLPHEEVIALHLKKLREAMLNIGYLVDPLIIDRKTKIVLDGNHRYRVLKDIGCPNAVCQLVDYNSPQITVGSWFPTTTTPISRLIKFSDEKPESVDFESGLQALDKKESYFMAVHISSGKKNCSLFNLTNHRKSIDGIIAAQQALLNKLKTIQFSYLADFRAPEALSNGSTVLYRKVYTKQEIVKKAKSGKPFPPKSTRHSIPNRIIRLNMKLGWLEESPAQSFKLMKAMLKKRVYNGNVRQYTESVIVIY